MFRRDKDVVGARSIDRSWLARRRRRKQSPDGITGHRKTIFDFPHVEADITAHSALFRFSGSRRTNFAGRKRFRRRPDSTKRRSTSFSRSIESESRCQMSTRSYLEISRPVDICRRDYRQSREGAQPPNAAESDELDSILF